MVSDAYVGVKVKFQVTWGGGGASPASLAANPSSMTGSGGPFYVSIWLLSHQMGTTSFTGTARACGTVLPDLELNATGDVAIQGMVVLNHDGLINPTIPNTSFDAITRTFADMGTQGFNPGDTLKTNATTGLLGLKDSAWDSATWPAACPSTGTCTGVTCPAAGMPGAACSGGVGGAFMGADITDDDGDGNPGVTAVPPSGTDGTSSPSCTSGHTCTYFLSPTSVSASSSQADKIYIVSRNRFALNGTRGSDCSKGSGKASITLFDNHVVGCHIKGGGACNDAQVGFVDTNRPIYVDAQGNAFSSSSPANNGTVDVYQFPQGMTPSCTDVRTQLP